MYQIPKMTEDRCSISPANNTLSIWLESFLETSVQVHYVQTQSFLIVVILSNFLINLRQLVNLKLAQADAKADQVSSNEHKLLTLNKLDKL